MTSGSTIFDILERHAAERPGSVALTEAKTGRGVTFGEMPARIDAMASKLASLGVQEGAVVAVVGRPSIDLVDAALACSRLKALCAVLMNPRNTELAIRAASPSLVVQQDPAQSVGRHSTTFSALLDLPNSVARGAGVLPEDPFYLNDTSGSTKGVPKYVRATHAQILANAEACVRHFEITSDDVLCCTFTSHFHELVARGLLAGARSVLLDRPASEDPRGVVDALRRHQVTCLMSNAATISVLSDLTSKDGLNLRLVESGGMPTHESLRGRVRDRLGAKLVAVWGSTETGGATIAQQLSGGDPGGSVGKPLSGYRVRVLDPSGRDVPDHSPGELVIEGDAVADAYIAGGEDERLERGCFRTGDVAWVDDRGYVFVRGRIANSFKVGGLVVQAETIETALQLDEGVAEAAVVATSHPVLGYVPAAVIRLREPRSLSRPDEMQVKRVLLANLERHLDEPLIQMPRWLKWTPSPLPRIGGKIDRRAVSLLFHDPILPRTRFRLSRRRLLVHAVKLANPLMLRNLLKQPWALVKIFRRLARGDHGA